MSFTFLSLSQCIPYFGFVGGLLARYAGETGDINGFTLLGVSETTNLKRVME